MKSLICAVTVLAVSTAQAATIYVDAANCPGPGDGSVRDPYCSIQTAIDNAVDTDEVVVAQGTYFETIDFLGLAITVRSTDPNNPAVVENTIINGCGLSNHTVVTCDSSEGSNTVLSGFVITNGNASFGAGMQILKNSSPTVTNCTFTGNTASPNGGAIWINSSAPTFTDCTFSGNSASARAGAMYNQSGSNTTVTNCMFSGNTANIDGGGMYNIPNSSPTVTDSVLCENTPENIFGRYTDGGGNCLAKTCDECGGMLDDIYDVGVCPVDMGAYEFQAELFVLCCPWNCGDGDGNVGIVDFLALLAQWGGPGSCDFDGGGVGINDFLDLLANWGPCPK